MDYINHNHTRAELGGMDEDMKLQIHSMEKEAYGFVLRAFIAQSDLLSWGKEGLITELRKELNVTDTEHGELLVKINSDESIKMIREWRKVAHNAQESLYTPGVAPDSVDNVVQKKVKISHSSVLKTQKHVPYGLPPLGSQSRKSVSHIQPFSGTLPSPKPEQFRGDQHSSELAMFSLGNPELSMRTVSHNNQVPSDGKRKGQEKSQPKKSLHAPNIKKRSNVIEIRATDKLIHKVERTIYGAKIPTPFQVEKAKLTLREHEKALLEALDKLADVSDGDDPPHETQHHYYQEHHGNGHGMAAHYNFYRQTGGIHDYLTESFAQRHSGGMSLRFVDVRGEEDIP